MEKTDIRSMTFEELEGFVVNVLGGKNSGQSKSMSGCM